MAIFVGRRWRSLFGNDCGERVYLLRDFTDTPGDIADPWYTGNFDLTYEQVLEGCQGLLAKCIKG